ncbi:MAG: N-acetylmuramoyl-L-alanine amidase [Flavipsychrobacter sp.]|nr:N-acetylmuramoyl-L-alanine amidase [Flavipsychrobacter sp.]
MRAIVVLAMLLAFSPVSMFAKGKKVSKIVIDAGHGGKDFGARGAISNEKDITLAVALKLGKLLTDSMRNMQVVYTRTEDAYPSLVERHEIANKSNGDLFISIHVNSTPYTYTRTLKGYKTVKRKGKTVKQPIYTSVRHHVTKRSGVETYVMGLHRAGQQKDAIGEYGENVSDEPGLLNENDPQTAIIVAQYAQAFLGKSVVLASKVQEQFALGGRPDLGVKQMGLEVLAGSAMPGVLVEIGFITNIEEEAYLNSEKGQYEVAVAIYRAIKGYKDDLEK